MYKLTKFSEILRIEDGATIPKDTGNGDYVKYLKWIEDGNTIAPYEKTTLDLQAEKDETDAAETRTYEKLRALKEMTPTQVKAWVTANVTNLSQAQDAIATLAIGMSILARRI